MNYHYCLAYVLKIVSYLSTCVCVCHCFHFQHGQTSEEVYMVLGASSSETMIHLLQSKHLLNTAWTWTCASTGWSKILNLCSSGVDLLKSDM